MADGKNRTIGPVLRRTLELGPTVAFFVIYMWIKDDSFVIAGREYSGFIIAALVFVPILLAAMAALYRMAGKLSRIQIFTALVVMVFGGLTAWFNDERFFKMKTTLVYGTFSLLLGIGLATGRSWLAYILDEFLPMKQEGWMILTRRLCLGFAVLAMANEAVWRTMSTDAWVKIETFGFPLALMVFLWAQIFALQSYFVEAGGKDDDRTVG